MKIGALQCVNKGDNIQYTFLRKQLCHFHFSAPFLVGSTLKGKNLLQEEQILSFQSRSHLGSANLSREIKGEVT